MKVLCVFAPLREIIFPGLNSAQMRFAKWEYLIDSAQLRSSLK
jgi:hypothetical protein